MNHSRASFWCMAAATFCLAVTLPAGAAPDSASNPYPTEAAAVLAPYDKAGLLSGSILVAKDGKIVFQKSYGLANREWDIRNDSSTRFLIGSITKQFTAVAIMQLVEQGKVGLDDPVAKYRFDAPQTWSKVTLRHLLNHTSGIANYTALPTQTTDKRNPHTAESLIALFRDTPLQFDPGTKFAYSNSGYALLGYVIEKTSGLSYCDYLQQNIFAPLDMRDSGCAVATQIVPRLASGYEEKNQTVRKADYIDPSTAYAAGQIYSTPTDLLRWQSGLEAARPITRASLALAQTDNDNHYGFGWAIGHAYERSSIGHNGGIDGYHSVLTTYPQDGLVVTYLSNFSAGPVERIAGELASLFFQDSGGSSAKILIANAEKFSRRMRHPAPATGSETALREMVEDFRTAAPGSSGAHQTIVELGALESITFKSVASDGADVFELQFDKGRLEWTILMGQGGVLASGFRRLP